jgi:hypothetical protein
VLRQVEHGGRAAQVPDEQLHADGMTVQAALRRREAWAVLINNMVRIMVA